MSEDIAKRLFGDSSEPSPGGGTGGGILSWVDKINQRPPDPPVRDNGSQVVDEKIAGEALYGGDVLDSYEPIISPVFQHEAYKARFDGNHEEALTINKAAQELGAVFKDYEVTDNFAKEAMQEAGDYLREQRSEDAIINTEESTMKVLREKYGDELEKNLAGVHRLAREIDQRVPNFIKTLDRTGLGNSLKVVEAGIQAARRKGYIK